MSIKAKKVSLWAASALMALVVCYCSLAILQAGSLYTDERAMFNLRFWGTFLVTSLIAAFLFGFFAIRIGKSGRRA